MTHPVDPTFRLNTPFRTDFGRNEHDTQGAVKRGREGGDHTEYGHADRAAAQTGSFAKAGHRLHISTPAVAKQINTFEKEYGLTLFDRSRSGVQLTKAGKEFVEDAQVIVRQCEESLRRAQRRSTDGIATVRLGVSILYPRPPHPRPMAARRRQAHRHPPETGVDARRLRSHQRHHHPPRRGRRSDIHGLRHRLLERPATPSPSIPSHYAWPCHAITH